MAEIMKESFRSVFTIETVLVPPGDWKQLKGIGNIQVERKEVKNVLEMLDITKVMGPNEVNGWILKE